MPNPHDLAQRVVRRFAENGWTLAVAESVTGGMVCQTITEIPGASTMLRGGVVAYATDAKHDILDVPDSVLRDYGAVSAESAIAMAQNVARKFTSDVGIATTGVAGPQRQENQPVGTVFIGLSVRGEGQAFRLDLDGSRREIRETTVERVLSYLNNLSWE